MKIKFQVLWIEDNFENVEVSIRRIAKKMLDFGFVFEVERKSSISEVEIDALGDKLKKYNPYDMIFFDYDLGGESLSGDKIAKKLRTNIFTDMIFYSGKAAVNLREALYKSDVQGVYTADRTRLVDESWEILEDHIKKICDINSMRGVILDEMSKIDLKMRELLVNQFGNLAGKEKEGQVAAIMDNLESRIKKTKQFISGLDLPEHFKKPIIIDFNMARNRLMSITKNDFFKNDADLHQKQNLRNIFAHNMTIFDDITGQVSLAGHEETYDFDKFIKIRKELIEISKVIDSIQ